MTIGVNLKEVGGHNPLDFRMGSRGEGRGFYMKIIISYNRIM